MFFQRLINFLFTDGVLRKLVTAHQQTADNECSGNDNFLHSVPQRKIGASVLLRQYVSVKWQKPAEKTEK
ncbi:hypothetical protein TUM17561_04330 [Enterobacter cloacae]|jgi:hypothetical protein|nr:hypothetical protein NMCA_21730 [Enterobacter ludwigii]GJK53015.1 hypothetical protein TUM17561_04330 [Enterobacter cloacae]